MKRKVEMTTYKLVVKAPNHFGVHGTFSKDFETEEDAKEYFRLSLKPFLYTLLEVKKFDSNGREIFKDERRFT